MDDGSLRPGRRRASLFFIVSAENRRIVSQEAFPDPTRARPVEYHIEAHPAAGSAWQADRTTDASSAAPLDRHSYSSTRRLGCESKTGAIWNTDNSLERASDGRRL